MLNTAEIREYISCNISSAWNDKSRRRLHLEQLPMAVNSDYDQDVHEFIRKLDYCASKCDQETYEMYVDELVDHYYINQENYKFD